MKKVLILNALVWALLILVSSWLLKDHENYPYVFAIAVFGFSLTHSFMLSLKPKSGKCNSQ